MRTDQAKRLTKLAAKKIGNSVSVKHQIWCHPRDNVFDKDTQTNEYTVSYFTPECEQKDFKSWQEAEAFLKNLALKGAPSVQEPDADAV